MELRRFPEFARKATAVIVIAIGLGVGYIGYKQHQVDNAYNIAAEKYKQDAAKAEAHNRFFSMLNGGKPWGNYMTQKVARDIRRVYVKSTDQVIDQNVSVMNLAGEKDDSGENPYETSDESVDSRIISEVFDGDDPTSKNFSDGFLKDLQRLKSRGFVAVRVNVGPKPKPTDLLYKRYSVWEKTRERYFGTAVQILSCWIGATITAGIIASGVAACSESSTLENWAWAIYSYFFFFPYFFLRSPHDCMKYAKRLFAAYHERRKESRRKQEEEAAKKAHPYYHEMELAKSSIRYAHDMIQRFAEDEELCNEARLLLRRAQSTISMLDKMPERADRDYDREVGYGFGMVLDEVDKPGIEFVRALLDRAEAPIKSIEEMKQTLQIGTEK